jgi:nitrogen fixation NifU-like protein
MTNTINEDLYQEAIIEWSKRTGNADHLEHVDKKGTASNPLCGDQVTVELKMKGKIIQSIAVQARGCVLCKASSYRLAESVKGLTLDNINKERHELDVMLRTPVNYPADFPESLRLFSPVRSHKSRHSCVLLPYDAVINALSSGCVE